MVNKCVYCKSDVANDVLDVCNKCGTKVWGPKMFQAIVASMQKSKDRGDLDQGSVK